MDLGSTRRRQKRRSNLVSKGSVAQLENEILQLDLEIGAIKRKAVSADSLSESLTTFDDLYQEALPEERRELIRLRVNQLIWTPDEIRLALFDTPQQYQRFDESQQLVARALHSLNQAWYGTNSVFFKDIGSMLPTSASARKGENRAD